MCWPIFIFVPKEILRWMLLSFWLCLTYDHNRDKLIVSTLLPFGEGLSELDIGLLWLLDVIH